MSHPKLSLKISKAVIVFWYKILTKFIHHYYPMKEYNQNKTTLQTS